MGVVEQGGLVGRAGELEWVARELDPGGVVLEGEAGIGKTTLWRAAVERARSGGFCVLTAAPAEAEQTYSYAVLGDLLGPVDEERLVKLPPPQRRALERAMLRAEQEEPIDVHVVGVALRSVLDRLSGGRGVVVAIDDCQWADAASVAVLQFALRRSSSARLLLALRKGNSLPFRPVGSTLALGPLTPTETHHLIIERLGVAWPPPLLRRIHVAAGGNPFFALELARANRPGGELVVPDSLQELVSWRVCALPLATRRRLAELALAGSVLETAELDPAVEAGVVERRDSALRFTHPLLGEAAISLLDPAERRELHRQIAVRTVEPDRRARHLALAADGSDEAVAAELAAAATGTANRGATAAAAELWELAGKLSEPQSGSLRAERLVQAGIAHWRAGNFGPARSLIESNLDRLPSGLVRQRALIVLSVSTEQQLELDWRTAVPAAERALAEIEDPWGRLELSQLLAAFKGGQGDIVGASEVAQAYLREAELGDGATLADALWFAAYWEVSCDRSPWLLIERARRLPESEWRGGWPAQPEPREVQARAFLREGRIDQARAQLHEWERQSRDIGSMFTHQGLFRVSANVELAAGNLGAAGSHADELVSAGEQTGNQGLLCEGLLRDATVALLRGETERARAQASRALELGQSARNVETTMEALATLGLLELSLGQLEEAAAWYRRVPEQCWRGWFYWAGGRVALDAVEALTATGDLALAAELASTLPDEARELPVAQGCLAAAAGDLEPAIDLVKSAPPSTSPFRRARELLLLGRLQRQARHRSRARETLEAARGEFDRFGAAPWAERGREELARLGGRSPAGARLTESERRVAELVAAGLSNKEVAARLVVTVRTVEAHLSKIYAKLGVHSRTELAARRPEL